MAHIVKGASKEDIRAD